MLSDYISKAGEASGNGVGDLASDQVRSAHLVLHGAEARAASCRARLGLDPPFRARMGRDVAATQVDIAQLLAGAREAGHEAPPDNLGDAS